MNDGVASGGGDDRYAAGGNMAPPQVLLGSGTFEDMRAFIYSCCSLLVSRDPGPEIARTDTIGINQCKMKV